MKKFILRIVRLFDRSAFVCAGCNRIAVGIAPRCRGGWACSMECFDLVRK